MPKFQEKGYSTKGFRKDTVDDADLSVVANDLTSILSGIYRECREAGAFLADIRIRWVTNPEDQEEGKFVLIAKRVPPKGVDDGPLIIAG